jgi:hypothetical protein
MNTSSSSSSSRGDSNTSTRNTLVTTTTAQPGSFAAVSTTYESSESYQVESIELIMSESWSSQSSWVESCRSMNFLRRFGGFVLWEARVPKGWLHCSLHLRNFRLFCGKNCERLFGGTSTSTVAAGTNVPSDPVQYKYSTSTCIWAWIIVRIMIKYSTSS